MISGEVMERKFGRFESIHNTDRLRTSNYIIHGTLTQNQSAYWARYLAISVTGRVNSFLENILRRQTQCMHTSIEKSACFSTFVHVNTRPSRDDAQRSECNLNKS
jgi:hypothetical protein